jgi:hypothetical protein
MENQEPEPKDSKKKNAELSEEDLKNVAGGATDYLLKIEGIDGESLQKGHEKELELD